MGNVILNLGEDLENDLIKMKMHDKCKSGLEDGLMEIKILDSYKQDDYLTFEEMEMLRERKMNIEDTIKAVHKWLSILEAWKQAKYN